MGLRLYYVPKDKCQWLARSSSFLFSFCCCSVLAFSFRTIRTCTRLNHNCCQEANGRKMPLDLSARRRRMKRRKKKCFDTVAKEHRAHTHKHCHDEIRRGRRKIHEQRERETNDKRSTNPKIKKKSCKKRNEKREQSRIDVYPNLYTADLRCNFGLSQRMIRNRHKRATTKSSKRHM